jgi:hypothetical protein
MALFNTNLHTRYFEQNLPVYPESKRRSRASLEIERGQAVDLHQAPKDFKLTEDEGKQRDPSYLHDAYLFGNTTARTPVSRAFFSQRNVDVLQEMARYMVWDQTGGTDGGHVISKQDEKDLLIVMMSMYKQFGTFPDTLDQFTIQREVDRLNLYTLRDVVPDIISNVKQYFGYLRDASQNPAPIPQPLNVNNTGTRELRAATDVFVTGASGFTQAP